MAKLNKQLTEEVVGSASWRKVAMTLAGMLVVLGLINAAVRVLLEDHTTNRSYWVLRKKWALLEQAPAPVDWLVLGDSSCNQGVRGDMISTSLGGSVLNLCTFGDMLVLQDAWMLARHIERLGKPRHVVIVHVYDMWLRSPSPHLRTTLIAKVPLPWGFWSQVDPPLKLSRDDLSKAFTARYVPLSTDTRSLMAWALHPELLLHPTFSVDDYGYMRSEVVDPRGVLADTEDHKRTLLATNRRPLSGTNRTALRSILRLADEHDLTLYFASSPIYEGLAELPAFKTYRDALMRELEREAAHSQRVRFLLPQPVTFSANQMENADHVNHAAATVYTERLVEAIQQADSEALEP